MFDNLKIDIEDFILEDLPLAKRYSMCEIVEQELQSLFQEQSPDLECMPAYNQIPEIKKMIPDIKNYSSARAAGREIAVAIFNGLTGNHLIS